MTMARTTTRTTAGAGAKKTEEATVVDAHPTARMRRLLSRLAADDGAATAEYVVATMAAVGFAGLLIVILRGDEVRGILTELIRNALTVG
jgi:Protein of unknown function (DUF4244)